MEFSSLFTSYICVKVDKKNSVIHSEEEKRDNEKDLSWFIQNFIILVEIFDLIQVKNYTFLIFKLIIFPAQSRILLFENSNTPLPPPLI